MQSIKDALDDMPLLMIGAEQLQKIVNYYKARPKNKNSGKPIKYDTAIHMIRSARRLFDYLDMTNRWEMPKRFNDIFRVSKNDFTPTREERLKARKGIQIFTVDELVILHKYTTPQMRKWLIVALNIGATQKELSDLMRGECVLDADPPYIEKVRAKTARGGEVIGKWTLWSETVDILKEKLSNEYTWDYKKVDDVYYFKSKSDKDWRIYDFQNEKTFQVNLKTKKKYEDKPVNDTDSVFGTLVYLNEDKIRIDYVRNSWFRLMQKVKGQIRELSFKYIRKTGAKIISDIAGKEIGKVYLAQTADDMIGKHYVPANYEKLADALNLMRTHLQPMFDIVDKEKKVK